jgi:hypothetical protein
MNHKFSFNPPSGFRDRDIRELQRTTQWLTDVAEREAGWWRDAIILVRADATVWVASDIMDRLTPPDSNSQFENALDTMQSRRGSAIKRLVEIAEQQKLIDDRTSASNTMNIAKRLRTLEPQASYLVDLDGYTRLHDHVEIIGRPFTWVRGEVSWLVDCLRPDPCELDRFGEPRGDDPPPRLRLSVGAPASIGCRSRHRVGVPVFPQFVVPPGRSEGQA